MKIVPRMGPRLLVPPNSPEWLSPCAAYMVAFPGRPEPTDLNCADARFFKDALILYHRHEWRWLGVAELCSMGLAQAFNDDGQEVVISLSELGLRNKAIAAARRKAGDSPSGWPFRI